MKILVIANPHAGAERKPEDRQQWKDQFLAHGVDAEIAPVPLEGLATRIKRAVESGVDAIVAAGGDGTIGAVASQVIGTGLPLGVIPAGTHNHFAKDMGIPLDPQAAIAAISGGFSRTCDVGEVNGHIFLNNSSIGAYPDAVKAREEEQRRRGGWKSTAMLAALLRTFRLRPLLRVKLTHDERTYSRRTPFVFVGNNEYGNLLKQDKRPRLDGSTLCLFTAKSTGLLCLLRLIWGGIRNRLTNSCDFEYQSVTDVKISFSRRTLPVSLDGEVVEMKGPLHYRVRPAALRVLVPKDPPP